MLIFARRFHFVVQIELGSKDVSLALQIIQDDAIYFYYRIDSWDIDYYMLLILIGEKSPFPIYRKYTSSIIQNPLWVRKAAHAIIGQASTESVAPYT